MLRAGAPRLFAADARRRPVPRGRPSGAMLREVSGTGKSPSKKGFIPWAEAQLRPVTLARISACRLHEDVASSRYVLDPPVVGSGDS